MQARIFYIGGVALTVYDSSYLVEVERLPRNPPREDKCTDLPPWVFHSKNAIWLAVENAPLSRRAQDGEKIKNELIAASMGLILQTPVGGGRRP